MPDTSSQSEIQPVDLIKIRPGGDQPETITETEGDDLTDTFEATDGIDLFAPFMEDELTGEVYFAFDEANAEGDLFFKSNGDGTIGVKDDKNNDDFDDLIVSLDLQSL